MLVSTAESRIAIHRPRTFAGLMTLYESNHLRFRQLAGDLRLMPDRMVSRTSGDLDLHARVLERCRYTTMLAMTYWFENDRGEPAADPDMQIRIYHDANLAEAVSCVPEHRHQVLRPFHTGRGGELERRWERNRMLNKWFEYCLEKGHAFRAV